MASSRPAQASKHEYERRRSHRLRRWLDRLLPPVCVVCGDPLARREGRVCGLCWSRSRRQRQPQCMRCGISLQDIGIAASGSSCIECEDWLPYLRQARAPFVMAGNAARIVHALKYGGWSELADEMGTQMGRLRFSPDVETELAGVLPVPLSRARARERGYNQAELLAKAVAEVRRLPLLTGVLQRHRHTQRQARLSPPERQTNVSRAFKVDSERRACIDGQHLLLVDDVLTTAATIKDCVRALCSSGARAVSVVTFARARRELPS